jgi:hypothetical protein
MTLTTNRMLSTISALTFIMTSACDQSSTVEKKVPDGETAFSCGALIYGAANYVESDEHKADLDFIKSKSLAAVTRFGTIHGTEKGIDGMQAFNEMKIKGLLMSGTPSGNSDELSTNEHVERAKACAEAV